MRVVNVAEHYDKLIDENNDSFRDSQLLKEYMDKWDGCEFIELMHLSENKVVLEVGVGTGRIANKTSPCCLKLYGIDISPKTINRAQENLNAYDNIELICADFMEYEFNIKFDIIYSTLAMMHFKDKQSVVSKIADLLNKDGCLVLSIDKNQNDYIEFGSHKLKIYPDSPENIIECINSVGMVVEKMIETEFAYIFKCLK